MSETLIYYLANTLMRGGVMVLSLLAVEFLLRHKLVFAGGRTVYLAALLLVLMPIGKIDLPRGGGVVPASAHSIEVPDWNVEWNRKPEKTAPPLFVAPAVPAAKILPAAPVTVEPASPAVPSRSWTLFDVLVILYFAVVLLLSAKQLRYYFIWRNRIRRCIAITGGRVYDVFLESKRLTGLERYPVMLLDGGGLLPVAACFGTLRHGAVLCPLREYGGCTDSELRMILIHELEHLRRKDNPVAFFLMMLSNLFFLNPFVRFLASRWAMVAEFDCDGRVRTTLQLGRREMAQYAGLLLSSQSGAPLYAPGRGLGASAANLKLRIQEFAMKRTKLQSIWYFTGICLLLVLGCFFIPELKADTREPVDPFVVKNLPAETGELIYFNGAALDGTGTALLDKAAAVSSSLDWRIWSVLSLMSGSEKNKGSFYLARGPKFGLFVLLKNGKDSDEMIIPPGLANQGMTIRKLSDGYFTLLSTGVELPKLGLPEALAQKIAAAPGEVLRRCRAGDAPDLVSIVNRNGSYTLVAIQSEDAGKKALTRESIVDKAVFYSSKEDAAAMKALAEENLKFSAKTLDGRNVCEIEFPLNEKVLPLWSDYIRKNREDREKENEPKVIALSPANGATGVDPKLKEIKVTFDRPMSPTSWSFCQRSDIDFPEIPTPPSYDKSHTVITLPVRLVPGKTYNIYLNSPPFLGFRSAQGGVLQSVHYTFTTAE